VPFEPPQEDDDDKLVQRIRAGDPDAWASLITTYQDRLYSVCVRMVRDRELATDLTQDSFVKIIQGLPSFDGRAKLSTWMIRITMNVCLSKLRSEKLRRHASVDAIREGNPRSAAGGHEFSQARELSPSGGVEAHEDRARVLRALQTLEPDQRAVLILADCQGHSYEEIAAAFNVAVGTIKSRLFRARTALRDAVEQLDAASLVRPSSPPSSPSSTASSTATRSSSPTTRQTRH
jgi:RNA polymerase sigma-70 factor (ECF subfamily)